MASPGDTPHRDWLREARRLRKDGHPREGLVLVREALRRNALSTEEVETAGRFIQRDLADAGEAPLRWLCLGQCTVDWLCSSLAAVAWGAGLPCLVAAGDYDNVLQTLDEIRNGQRTCPDGLILLPWNQRLLSESGLEPAARLEAELAFWQQVWSATRALGISRVVQIGYDWVLPGSAGFHATGHSSSDIHLVRSLNDTLLRDLPDGFHFLALENLSGTLGRSRFYDPRRYHWTKQPFSDPGTLLLARHVFAGIRALTTGPKKLLVLDLDNTLWGGVIGESDPAGLALGGTPEGEAFVAFQAHLKQLAKRGVLLAVCSKNNPADARGPFELNPNMVLGLNDFVAFEANWAPKADNLRKIARELDLGLDACVFFDDSKAEQEHIRQTLPQVAVVDVPEDPAEYVRCLQEGLWFETLQLTAEDAQRTAYYVAERQRREASQACASTEDYLRSLGMVARIERIDETNLARVVQLLAKTNQFNLTTRRHREEQVRQMLAAEGSLGLALHLKDRFGDYGLVALVLGLSEPTRTLRIDTLLLSCRVIGRTVEYFLMERALRECVQLGFERVLGEYIPTPKNQLVSGFWESMGFRNLGMAPDGVARQYELTVGAPLHLATFVLPQD